MGYYFRRFRILLWKNVLIQSRRRIEFIFLILFPAIVLGSLLIARGLSARPIFIPGRNFKTVDVVSDALKFAVNKKLIIYLTPQKCIQCNEALMYIERIPIVAKAAVKIEIIETETTDEMDLALRERKDEINVLGGVQFPPWAATARQFYMKTLALITIRFLPEFRVQNYSKLLMEGKIWNWMTDKIFKRTTMVGDELDDPEGDGDTIGYHREQLGALLSLISEGINGYYALSYVHQSLIYTNSTSQWNRLMVERFSEHSRYEDLFLAKMIRYVPFAIVIAFMPMVYVYVHLIGSDHKMQVMLKWAGLSNWEQYTVWLFLVVVYAIIMAIFALVTICTRPSEILNGYIYHSDVGIVAAVIICYTLANIAYTFMMSNVCGSSEIGSVMSLILFLVTSAPIAFEFQDNKTSQVGKESLGFHLIALFHNACLGAALKIILTLEIYNEGINYTNVNTYALEDPELTLAVFMRYLLMDVIIYTVIGVLVVFLRHILQIPPKQWISEMKNMCYKLKKFETYKGPKVSEGEPVGLNPVVKFRSVSLYTKHTQYLSKLSMNCYDRQTTFIIGSNACGKSLILELIAGLVYPTEGKVICDRYHCGNTHASFHGTMSYCSHKSTMYDELTLIENLSLFCYIRDVDPKYMQDEITHVLNGLGLDITGGATLYRNLPPHMKRLANLALAFVGGPRTILLDEPTRAFDYNTKMKIWSFIDSVRPGKAVIITSSDMTETEILADRVYIMKNKELIVSGTLEFIYECFEMRGFHLILTRHTCGDNKKLTDMLAEKFDVKLVYEHPYVLDYYIHPSKSDNLEKLLRFLSDRKAELCLQSYNIHHRSLDEIYLDYRYFTMTKDYTTLSRYKMPKFSFPPLFGLFLHRFRSAIWINYILTLTRLLVPIACIYIFAIIEPTIPEDIPELPIEPYAFSHDPIYIRGGVNFINTVRHMFPYIRDNFRLARQGARDAFKYMAQFNYTSTVKNLLFGVTDRHKAGVWCYYNGLYFYHAINFCYFYYINFNFAFRPTLHPLNFTDEIRITNRREYLRNGFIFSNGITTGFCVITGLIALPYIQEKTSGFQDLIKTTGNSLITYWLTAYLFDFLLNILFLNLIFYLFYAWFEAGDLLINMSEFQLLILIFGASTIFLSYFVAHLFRSKSFAFLFICIFTGGLSVLPFTVFSFQNPDRLVPTFMDLLPLKILVPHYPLCYSFYDLFVIQDTVERCELVVNNCAGNVTEMVNNCWKLACDDKPICCDATDSGASLVSVAVTNFILFTAMSAALYVILILFLNWTEIFGKAVKIKTALDADGKKVKIKKDEMKEFSLIVINVSRKSKIRNISFSARKGECIAMTGMGSSGKSALFDVLSQIDTYDSGLIMLDGNQLSSRSMKKVGYNPILNAIPKYFTINQFLSFMAALKGFGPARSRKIIRELLVFSGLPDNIRKTSYRNLIDSTKRQISNLAAIIGDPQFLFFKNPTEGMDSDNQMHFWTMVAAMKSEQKTIVVATKDLDLCSKFCEFIGIMNRGFLVEFDTPQLIKETFANCILLLIKLSYQVDKCIDLQNIGTLPLDNFIKTKFNNALLKICCGHTFLYEIPYNRLNWPHIFGIMENAKDTLQIQRYYIRLQTIGQVAALYDAQTKAYY